MSKNLKKVLVAGASLLMFASVGAGANSASASTMGYYTSNRATTAISLSNGSNKHIRRGRAVYLEGGASPEFYIAKIGGHYYDVYRSAFRGTAHHTKRSYTSPRLARYMRAINRDSSWSNANFSHFRLINNHTVKAEMGASSNAYFTFHPSYIHLAIQTNQMGQKIWFGSSDYAQYGLNRNESLTGRRSSHHYSKRTRKPRRIARKRSHKSNKKHAFIHHVIKRGKKSVKKAKAKKAVKRASKVVKHAKRASKKAVKLTKKPVKRSTARKAPKRASSSDQESADDLRYNAQHKYFENEISKYKTDISNDKALYNNDVNNGDSQSASQIATDIAKLQGAVNQINNAINP